MFSESSTGCWAVLQLPCCPSKQRELSENILHNLFSLPDAPDCSNLPIERSILSLTMAVGDPPPCSVSRDAAVAPGVQTDVGVDGGGGSEAPSETEERRGFL